ncbi:MAG: sigma-70 family RNA polymerase sigma factor [Thermodesulfobacteriota bacterium]
MELFLLTGCLVAVVSLAVRPALPEREEIAALVAAARAGDQAAFERLVLLFQTRIYNLALGYLKHDEEARDISQDIFVSAFRTLDTLKDDSKFAAWLYQLGVNHCRNRYRQLRRRGFYDSVPIDDPERPLTLAHGDSPERLLERQRLRALVLDAIAAMNEADKEILLLRDIQGLAYDEISTVLGLPLGTVKSKLNRARLALKDRLKRFM